MKRVDVLLSYYERLKEIKEAGYDSDLLEDELAEIRELLYREIRTEVK